MRFYETLFICRQELSASQVEAVVDKFQSILTSHEGTKIGRREIRGLKTLAYKINKNRKGHFVLLNYQTDSRIVDEMERQMRLTDDVVRYITVATKALETEDNFDADSSNNRSRTKL